MYKIKNKKSFGFRDLEFSVWDLFRISPARLNRRSGGNFEFRISRPARGFTIVETLVAIAILLLSITGPLGLAEKGLAAAEASRHEITAFYLGHEAIEYVRNIRDGNAIGGLGGGASWLQGLSDCMNASGCGIDVTAPPGQQIIGCTPANYDCALYEYTGSAALLQGLFGHRTGSGWTKTDLIRKTFVEEIQNDVEARITVTIVWRAGSLGLRTTTFSENIFNWYVSN